MRRPLGALALERSRADAGPACTLGQRVGQSLAADDEDRDGQVRVPGGVLTVGRTARPVVPAGGGHFAPGQGREIVEDPGDESELLLPHGGGIGGARGVVAPIECGQRLLERPRHRVEPQQAGARAEGMDAPAQLVTRRA